MEENSIQSGSSSFVANQGALQTCKVCKAPCANACRTSQIANGSKWQRRARRTTNDNEWERGSLSFCVTLYRGFLFFFPKILDLKLTPRAALPFAIFDLRHAFATKLDEPVSSWSADEKCVS